MQTQQVGVCVIATAFATMLDCFHSSLLIYATFAKYQRHDLERLITRLLRSFTVN